MYDFDIQARTMKPVAGNIQGTLCRSNPTLTAGSGPTWRADHLEHGYIYVFVRESFPPDDAWPVLVLCDQDRDGELDRALHIAANDWAEAGFNEPSSYVPN